MVLNHHHLPLMGGHGTEAFLVLVLSGVPEREGEGEKEPLEKKLPTGKTDPAPLR